MKLIIKIFTITFIITFLGMATFDIPQVQKYVKKQIRQAKMLTIMTKYNVKPEGLSS